MIVDFRFSAFDFRIFPSAIDNGQWTMDNEQSSGPAWVLRVCYTPGGFNLANFFGFCLESNTVAILT